MLGRQVERVVFEPGDAARLELEQRSDLGNESPVAGRLPLIGEETQPGIRAFEIAPGGNMTPSEFSAAVVVARMSASDIQELLGIDEPTRSQLASGEKPVPRCVALCLWLMAAYGVSILEARVLAEDPGAATSP